MLEPSSTPPEVSRPRRSIPIWPFALVTVLMVVGVAAVAAWNLVLPYYAVSPGPVKEVGELIEVGAEVPSFPINGDLYLLTVLLQPVNVYEYLQAQVDPQVDVVPREVVRPEGTTEEQLREINRNLMDESQQKAVCVALRYLDYETHCTGKGAEVAGFVGDTPATSVLREGDLLVAIEGKPVRLATDAQAAVAEHQVGETITMTVRREGEELDVEVVLVENSLEPGQPMVGIYLDTIGLEMEVPFEVEIDARNIGGPSAGMMYALGIVDLLSEGDLIHGELIAGTGSIELDGSVGAIGGVRQKVHAARAAGASYVLVPAGNYEEARTAAGGNIQIIAVQNLDEAVAFLEGLSPGA